METKHTKGQWVVAKTGKKKWERVFTINSITSCDKCGITRTMGLVGEIRESAVGLEEAEANAKLIAAAPQMLEALNKIGEWLIDESPIPPEKTMDMVWDAIKKATT